MPIFECTVIFDASAPVSVEAGTPEEAAVEAEEKLQGAQHLCNQCSNTLDTGDVVGVHVYSKGGDHKLLDTTLSGELGRELETERMRLASCGVIALANTRESARKAREMLPAYRRGSADDVARAVDREMLLREAIEQVAKSWDGRMFNLRGCDVDIGASIREQVLSLTATKG
ncbi:MAG: hypothetical protein RSD57_12415 [Comamonas sp.]